MKPLISKQFTGNQLLNPARPYVQSVATDIRETFKNYREAQVPPPASKKVRRIK